jgi:3-deoxy-D-manno-octulosonate 8-phosphate phosphatase (KDO 8-P phosphatase)
MQLNETLLTKLRNIRMVLLDVDGVMTNGQVMLLPDGEELKFFSIHDGFGIVCAMKSGIRIGIISGRSSRALKMRCEELNIEDLYMDTMEKLPALERISAERKIPYDQIAFVGDDVPDLPVLERVGLSVAPQNAHSMVKDRVDLILKKNGGDGAVREFLDLLLETQGKLDSIIKKYSSG